DEHIKFFLESIARFEETEKPVNTGDMVQIDFTGTIEGKPVSETVPEAGDELNSQTDFWMMVNERSFLPGVSSEMEGMSIGDTKEIVVTFPEDSRHKPLAGKTANYTVTLKKIREKMLPELDDELLKKFSYENVEDMRKEFRSELEARVETENRSKREEEATNILLEKTSIDLPESQVQEETQALMYSLIDRNLKRGVKREDVEKHIDEIKDNAEKQAIKNIKLDYILSQIADEEKISADEEDVELNLKRIAQQDGQDPEKLRSEMEESGRMDYLRSRVRNKATLDFIIENSKPAKDGILDKIIGS
ncbi:MAG: trigger factor, partial [Lentisphaerae bacterium]|nr:trigger factor [Lentisphaerota bacterium]